MANKATVIPLVVDHFNTLRDVRTGRLRWQDIAFQFALPVALAALATWRGARLTEAGQIIAGAAVLAGFSFGLAVFVFQLRLEASRDPRVPKGSLLLDLIDELFKNVNYLILSGLALVVLAAAGVAYADPNADQMSAGWTLAITAVSLHYVVTLGMCLKRMRAAYRQLSI